MTDKPDPAAVEAAVKAAQVACDKPGVYKGDVTPWVAMVERVHLRTLLASHTALKAERDEALVEAYARATPIGAVPLPVKRGGQS